jgi:hypothetical protein
MLYSCIQEMAVSKFGKIANYSELCVVILLSYPGEYLRRISKYMLSASFNCQLLIIRGHLTVSFDGKQSTCHDSLKVPVDRVAEESKH